MSVTATVKRFSASNIFTARVSIPIDFTKSTEIRHNYTNVEIMRSRNTEQSAAEAVMMALRCIVAEAEAEFARNGWQVEPDPVLTALKNDNKCQAECIAELTETRRQADITPGV